MKRFKVIALSCSGKGKRIFDSGDIVTEADFPESTAAELVDKGFLLEIKWPEKIKEVVPEKEVKKAKKEVN